MPLFNNSSSNILPDIDSGDMANEDLPKPDGKRRLSLKMSFFNWSSQKQYIDKNKFLFDSGNLPSKDKKTSHNSFIIKSNKYSTSHPSVNYDESENEYSSGSDLNDETSSKDYYSMEDLDNIPPKKTKQKKVRKVAPLSESTLCYSSNTNTINTVSLEFNGKNKLISNNDVTGAVEGEIINYGLEDNPNIEEVVNNGYAESPNEDKMSNNLDGYDEENDDVSDENDESNDELSDSTNYNVNYTYVRKPSKLATSVTNKKTVTFCEDIVIIEPKTYKRTNILKRAFSKIMKKKGETNKVVI